MTVEERLAELEAENKKLREERTARTMAREITPKVSEKGGVSLYGLGRFPVTLYEEQWQRVIKFIKEGNLEVFIAANKHLLKSKPVK